MPTTTDRSAPDDVELCTLLGRAKPAWDAVLAHLDETCADASREWKQYGAQHGWQVKVSRRRRALLYLTPHEGQFTAALALGEAAVKALGHSGLPSELITDIACSPTLPEGKAARVDVKTLKQTEVVARLLALKLAE